MERLTYDFCVGDKHCWQVKGAYNLECREVCRNQGEKGCTDCPIAKAFDRLRELAQAYQLLGNTVYEPNKRGVISTYKVISVHFSGCSILVGWDLLDGIYSNLNGFEISALGKTVFLTREAAEAALDAMGGENNA